MEPVFRGTRIPISYLSQYLENGYSVEEFIELRDVDPEVVRTVYEEELQRRPRRGQNPCMKALLDNQLTPRFRHKFPFCEVETAAYRGWTSLDDDELLQWAEGAFDVLVTLDTSLRYQRNISLYEIGIVVLDTCTRSFFRI